MEFMKNGVKHMRMKFYIEGPIRRGTVNLEVYQVFINFTPFMPSIATDKRGIR